MIYNVLSPYDDYDGCFESHECSKINQSLDWAYLFHVFIRFAKAKIFVACVLPLCFFDRVYIILMKVFLKLIFAGWLFYILLQAKKNTL